MINFLEWLIEENKPAQQFNLRDTNPDWLYEIFKQSYMKSTGTAFSKENFISKASTWTFFGIPPSSENDPLAGFVAVRFQPSGLVKLTGVAGNPRGIFRGVDQLNNINKPVWGAVSADIANMATKKGFKEVPPFVLKIFAQKGIKIPGMEIDDQGNIKADIAEIGVVNKKAIVNDLYIDWIKKQHPDLPISSNMLSNPMLAIQQKNSFFQSV
jgi:hypothetical protein